MKPQRVTATHRILCAAFALTATGVAVSQGVPPSRYAAADTDFAASVERVQALMTKGGIEWPKSHPTADVPSASPMPTIAPPQPLPVSATIPAGPPMPPADATAKPVLTESAQSEDVETRLRALEGLAQTGGPEHVDDFVAALCDEAPEVRTVAARVLVRLDSHLVFEKIMAVLTGGNPEAVARLYSVLPELKEPLQDALVGVLSSPEQPALRRQVAAYSLGRMNSVQALPALVEGAWSGDADLSLWCVNALLTIQDPVVMPRLAELAAHPLPEVRRAALQGLADMGGPAAIDALSRIALEPPEGDQDAAGLAVTLLGATTDEEVVPVLIEVMRRNVPLRRAAVESLRRITKEDLGDRPSDWQEWYDNRRQAQTAEQGPSPEEFAPPPWDLEFLPE